MTGGILRLTAVVFAALALSGALTAADDSYCKKDCVTNVIAKGSISGNGSKKGHVIATDKGQLTWAFRKAGSVAAVVNVQNFSPDCPGVFLVDNTEQPPCGFTLSWNAGDQNTRNISFTATKTGRFKFHVYSRDNSDDSNPNDIDPDLEIDTGGGFAPLLLIRDWLAPIAAIVFLLFGYWFGFSRGARTARS